MAPHTDLSLQDAMCQPNSACAYASRGVACVEPSLPLRTQPQPRLAFFTARPGAFFRFVGFFVEAVAVCVRVEGPDDG